MEKFTAIVLAAGSGSRMGLDVKKQYLMMENKPLVFYALDTFQRSRVDEIILVVSPGDEAYAKEEIVDKYSLTKVSRIVPGGKERYDSVYEGLKAADGDYVLIHDGARAFVTEEIILRAMEDVKVSKANVVAVPVKDTIKLSDKDGYVADTIDRSRAWSIQTPQSFSLSLIKGAYEKALKGDTSGITDDAMIIEKMTDCRVKFVEGSYDNIKVTTVEDIALGEIILKKQKRC